MKYYIALQEVLGAGSAKVNSVLKHFGAPRAVFEADKAELGACGLFSAGELKKIAASDFEKAENIIEKCKFENIKILTLGSEGYPYSLSVTDSPPLVIYVKGTLPDFENIPSVCIVGPRRVSDYGKKAAFSLGYRLTRAGFTVVSGGAVGTDTCAHAGALKAGGVTALVMGCGILNGYLPENRALREAIAENGCLISEYPPDAPTTRYSFPVRNRIMSALTLGTVVVEAGEKSGALITAHHAYEQGKDVFVIPHEPGKKEYAGSNALLRDGAKPLLDVSDIFNEYIVRFPDKINIERAFNVSILPSENKKTEKNITEALSKEAKIVYNCLDKQKFLPEEIQNTGLSPAQVLSALTELEMEFLIKALPGGMYERCE